MSRRRPKPHRTGRWYVDNAAVGTNAGTSWTNAWNSFASINWASVLAGDTIYISGGSVSKTYTTALTIGKSGASGNPIVITRGVDPNHNGTVIIDGTTSTTQDSTTAMISTAGFTNLTIQNLTLQNTMQDCIRVAGTASGTVLIQNCTFNVGNGYTTLTTNGATAAGSAVLNFASVPSNLQTKAGDFFSVKDQTSPSVLPTVWTTAATATTVTLTAAAIGAGVASGHVIQFGAVARAVLITTTSGTGVVVVKNNLIDAPVTIGATRGISLTGNTAGSVTIENNTITIANNDPHGGYEAITSYQDATFTIRNNTISHTAAAQASVTSIVVGDIRPSTTGYIYNNVITRVGGDYHAIDLNNDDITYTGGLKVWNNTIYGASHSVWMYSPSAATEVKNNLFYIPDGATGVLHTPGLATALVAANIDYNAYLGTGAAIVFGNNNATTYATFATWQGTGYEVHGVGSGAANFTNVGTGDFHISSTSAAADKGVVIATFTTDKDGNNRSPAAYDIGAYEAIASSVPLPATPTGLVLLAVSSTTINVGMNLPSMTEGGVRISYEVAASPGYIQGPIATVCTPGVGSVTDSLGNVWTVTAGAQLTRNGVVDPVTANVTAGWVVNGVFWQVNTAANWYAWTGSWSAGTSTNPFAGGGIQISGLTASTAYNVRAYAFNSGGNSGNTAAIAATTSGSGTGGDQNGVQAGRIADLMERMGFNVYPSLQNDGSSVYGTSPANYSVASVTAAYKFFTGSTVMVLWSRLWNYYHYDILTTWAPAHYKATGANISMEVGGDSTSLGGSLNKTNPQEIAQLAAESHAGTGNSAGAQFWMKMSEGWNEPNGIGGESGEETSLGDEARASLLSGYSEIRRATASLVLGLPNPENYPVGTFQTTSQKLRSITAAPIINVHYYPSQNLDFNDPGSIDNNGELNDVVRGSNVLYNVAQGSHEQICTEWHSTLFMLNTNPNAQSGRWDDAHDSYFTFLFIMSTYRIPWTQIFWYALYDFGTAYQTGMWHANAQTETPRAEAYVVRAMFQLLGESSASTKRSFTTSKLNYSITGLPGAAAGNAPNSGGKHMLFQNSSGRFGLFIWNSQQAPGGTAVNVTVNFLGSPATRVAHYDLTSNAVNNMTALAIQNGPLTSFTFPLNASGHLLLIDVAAVAGTLPTEPQNPSVSAITSTSMTLTVAQPATVGTGTLTYTWQRSAAGANSWTTAGTSTSAASTVSFAYTGLTASTAYDLRVSVTNTTGTGPYSTTATGTTSGSTGLPGDATGTTARRIADMMESFGANCFPNGQGGSSAGASISQHSIGFNYLCGGSGMGMFNRIYANSTGLDVPFMTQLSTSFPGTKWTSCINWTASSSNVVVAEANTQSLYSSGIFLAEGYNEPENPQVNDLGPVPVATCLSAQQQIYAAAHPHGVKVVLPSVMFLGSSTYETDYMGATTSSNWQGFMANADYSNGHDYPNSYSYNADAMFFAQYLQPLTGKPTLITEYHPLLYNSPGARGLTGATGEAFSAYHTPIALLSGHVDHGNVALQWYCFYDYLGAGFAVPVGLFRNADPNNPTPAATVIRSMYQLTTDLGSTKRSFAPSKLAYSISNLAPAPSWPPFAGGRHALFQNSSGTFFIFVWNEQNLPGGTARSVTLTLTNGARSRIRRWNLTASPVANPTAAQDVTNASTLTWSMSAEVHLIRIDW